MGLIFSKSPILTKLPCINNRNEISAYIPFFLHFPGHLPCTKKVLTPLNADEFPELTSSGISSNGKYVFYTTKSNNKEYTQSVKTTDGRLLWEFVSVVPFINTKFSEDGTSLLFQKKDSIYLLDLSRRHARIIPGCKSFKMGFDGDIEWLTYRTLTDKIKLQNLRTNITLEYNEIKDYIFNDDGTVLLLLKEKSINGIVYNTVQWLDLKNKRIKEIWHGAKVTEFIFNNTQRC